MNSPWCVRVFFKKLLTKINKSGVKWGKVDIIAYFSRLI